MAYYDSMHFSEQLSYKAHFHRSYTLQDMTYTSKKHVLKKNRGAGPAGSAGDGVGRGGRNWAGWNRTWPSRVGRNGCWRRRARGAALGRGARCWAWGRCGSERAGLRGTGQRGRCLRAGCRRLRTARPSEAAGASMLLAGESWWQPGDAVEVR
jgi:hypothetical protein